MKTKNVIQQKTYDFALKVILFCIDIQKMQKEYVLTKQLIKSGTSIGANIEEAIGGQSRKDFFAKLTISYKEARETHYWLRLLKDTGLASPQKVEELIYSCDEILRIIGAIQKKIKATE